MALVARPDQAVTPQAGPVEGDFRLAASRSGRTYFPMGWFDHLQAPDRLPSFRAAGMNTVMPYTGLAESPQAYLDRAHREGVKVFVEIDRALLILPDPNLVSMFVNTYKNHPALYGWLLMDEPTLDNKFGFMTPAMAESLYRSIRATDPKHPVGIVFGVKEDPRPWMRAMDIMLFDDYVQAAGSPEFWGLDKWLARLHNRAMLASNLYGYIPVLQSFGQDVHGQPQMQKRLPTVREMRYITYAAIQASATGVFFFSRFFSRSDWADSVLAPISKQIAPASKALAAGQLPAIHSSSSHPATRSTIYRDPTTGMEYLIVVNHANGPLHSEIRVDRGLGFSRAYSAHGSWDMRSGGFVDLFGPFSAHLYRLA